jgi:hypothetical protein
MPKMRASAAETTETGGESGEGFRTVSHKQRIYRTLADTLRENKVEDSLVARIGAALAKIDPDFSFNDFAERAYRV